MSLQQISPKATVKKCGLGSKSVAFDQRLHFLPKDHASPIVTYKTVPYSLWPYLPLAKATFPAKVWLLTSKAWHLVEAMATLSTTSKATLISVIHTINLRPRFKSVAFCINLRPHFSCVVYCLDLRPRFLSWSSLYPKGHALETWSLLFTYGHALKP